MWQVRGEHARRYSVTFAVLGVYEGAMASDVSFGLPLPLARSGSDAALLARAIRGDHDAYADLVRPHERVAYRVAAAITGGSADAEEAMQNAFVKAYRSLHRFRSGAPFRPWLLKIVVREAHNVLRAERRHARLGARAAEQHRPEVAGPDEALIAREEVETVLGALARLPRSDRVALALRYFAELPDKDAATLLGTTAQAYRVRLVRARRRLQDLLEERRHDD
jgi:RNA polymerase sigma factor (sigma-70 family)